MRSKGFLRICRFFALSLLLVITSSGLWAASYEIVYGFSGTAQFPSSGLVVDTAGNAYGTTSRGGNFGGFGGTVYELSPKKGFSVLYAFSAPPDGINPQGNLAIDSAGNLYGTTIYGGANKTGCGGHGCGTVFMLAPPTSKGGSWTETILYSFTGGDDGSNPQAGVILDSAGNLYGTAATGAGGCGTVFKLTQGIGGVWGESVIYTIGEGCNPVGSLLFDSSGDLYGTVSTSGPGRGGLIFELSPTGDTWVYNQLYVFDGFPGSKDASGPGAGLIFDAAGNLYGTTAGGGDFGFGTVFELTANSGVWTESILYSFASGKDGASPRANLVFDPNGNLYSTTYAGGQAGCGTMGCGTVFELVAEGNGQWKERLFRFPADGSLGLEPTTPLILDSTGHVFGTTSAGGETRNGDAYSGVAFRIAP